MRLFWIGSFLLLLLAKWVDGFLLYNEIEQSIFDSHEVMDAAPTPKGSNVELTLINGAAATGAVCLDGTLPGYHLDRGHGTGENSWLIQLEGGGWCNNIKSCVFRKTSERGSSAYMERDIFTGILSNDATKNPGSRVRIQRAAHLVGCHGRADVKGNVLCIAVQALLSGCSAGGLASIMHCDEFRGLFSESTKVKCLSDGGLFLDVADVSGNNYIRNFYDDVVSLQGVEKNLPIACTNHLDPTSCFFPRNVIAGVKTPLFLLNSAYDSWQIQVSLTSPSADPYGDWKDCRLNISACSTSQIQILQKFRGQMLDAIKNFAGSTKNGLFINSCFAHWQSETQNIWFSDGSPSLGNKAIAVAVGDWYFNRGAVKSIDCPYPCDKTCHTPARN